MDEWIEPLRTAVSWRRQGQAAAVASVIKTWGSSPCPVSSRLAVNAQGGFVGSVSAGCVEGQIIAQAQDVMHTGRPRTLTFGVADETVWSVGLACGGEITVLLAPFEETSIAVSLIDAQETRKPATLITNMTSGAQALRCGSDILGDTELASLLPDIPAPGVVEASGGDIFVECLLPRRRMLLVGAVHIAQDMARMARLAGFEVVVIDPRGAFATEDRFPGIPLRREWPDEALENLRVDAQTCIVTLAHDPKIDDTALLWAARSPAFYIAALGSRRTHGRRVERLAEAGLAPMEIDRVRGPAGLDIGSLTPPEIAISIVAEAISLLREDRRQKHRPPGRPPRGGGDLSGG
jgi:xanthine dehydrogenase accessory factor